MPRIRSLKPEALQHRKVGRLSDRAFRLWIALITQADDGGRLPFDAPQYRLLVWGYHGDISPKDVAAALDELRAYRLCRLYTDGDCLYVDLPSWRDHQKINKALDSKLPGFTPDRAYSGSTPVGLPEPYGSTTGGSIDQGSIDQGSIDRSNLEPRAGAREAAEPASALGGAPARRPPSSAQDHGHTWAEPPPLGDAMRQFMAKVREAAATPASLPPPPRRDREFRSPDPPAPDDGARPPPGFAAI